MEAVRTSPLDRRLSRRLLLGGLAASAADALFGHASAAPPPQKETPGVEGARIVLQAHGFHAAPDRGGGRKVDLQIADMRNLAATSVTVILPTEEYLGKAVDARFCVIARLHFINFGDIRYALDDQLAIHKGIQTPIFQVGNEIDQEGFAGRAISPEQFNREVFLPVVKETRDNGGKILIPPMAPGSPTEDGYLDGLLREIKATIPPDVIQESLGLSIHNYFYPGQDPLERVRKIYQQAKNILGPLPIYITEAGLNQDRTRFYPDTVIRDETLRYVKMPLGDLPIAVNNWWLIGNRVFRGPPLPEHATIFADFETYAWRKEPDSITPVYDAVSNFARQMNKGRVVTDRRM